MAREIINDVCIMWHQQEVLILKADPNQNKDN